MEPCGSIEYTQKEHLEMVRLADKLADALKLAAKDEFNARQQGLADLRLLQHGLLGISQHCNAENGILESDFHHYLDANQYDRLRKEHQTITRLVASLLRELPYVTADSVKDLCPAGEELVERVHQHVALEEDMLWRVQEKQYEYQ